MIKIPTMIERAFWMDVFARLWGREHYTVDQCALAADDAVRALRDRTGPCEHLRVDRSAEAVSMCLDCGSIL